MIQVGLCGQLCKKNTMSDDKVPELQSDSAAQNERLQRVPDMVIDKDGVFKYILIKVHDKDDDDDYKYIVRGTVRGEYHADIYEMYADQIEKNGLDCEVVGGGRIKHQPKLKKIHIYGYSQGYGLANHAITKAILDKHWENYTITWANEGY